MLRGSPVPIPVAERSKARVCGRSLAGVAGSNPAGSINVLYLLYSKNKRQRPSQLGQTDTDKYKARTKKSWFRYCDTSRKIAGSIPEGIIGNFH